MGSGFWKFNTPRCFTKDGNLKWCLKQYFSVCEPFQLQNLHVKNEGVESLFVGEKDWKISSAWVSTCQQDWKVSFCVPHKQSCKTWDKMSEKVLREESQGSPAVSYRVFTRRYSKEKMYSFCRTFQTAETQNYSTCSQWSMHITSLCTEER